MRRFEASPRRATPKGQTFINCTAPPSPGPSYAAQAPAFVAHPPGQSTAIRRAPPKAVLIRLGFDVTYVSNDTSTAIPKIRTAHRLPDPHLTHRVRLFPSRSPRRSSANAAPGGLEPPAVERFRRAYLHLSQSIALRSLDYMIRPLSTFVAHQGSGHGARLAGSLDRLTWLFAAMGRLFLALGAPKLM